MSDFLRSIIRTGVPAAVGAVVAWLARRGFDLDSEVVTLGIGWVSSVLYYLAARVVETAERRAGWLLGVPGAPSYGPELSSH